MLKNFKDMTIVGVSTLLVICLFYLEDTVTMNNKSSKYELYSSCVSKPMPIDLFTSLSDEGIALLLTNTVCDKE